MDTAETEILSLQDYITSVDKSTLPRVLQICSGVYFQGSVYEISGSEVCLSTGDLLKVIGIELQSVTRRDTSTNETSELPLDYAGRFRIVPEDAPFGSIEEMVDLIRIEADGGDPFTFTCPHDLELEGHTVPADKPVSLLSVERPDGEGEGLALCRLGGRGHREAGREILVSLSVRGVFHECESSRDYSVREIVGSPWLRCRQYRYDSPGRGNGPFELRPVHSVQAIMHMRKNVVQFPSSLEVDLVDVSERCGDVTFVKPRTLAEVAAQPAEAFPAVAEVLEVQESERLLFHCRWLPLLQAGRRLVLHGVADPAQVLASSFKGKNERRHFLLSRRYGGGFRRRPRNFSSVYELYAEHCRAAAAQRRGPGLTVTVAMDWEATADGFTSVSVGEQLEVLRRGTEEVQREEVEVLVCRRMSEADEEDEEEEEEEEEEGRGEESEEVRLPMYLHGQFVEKLADTKKRYSLAELEEHFSFPLDVKVFRRDPSLEADPLPALSCLQLEQAVSEPAVLASLLEQPEHCFLLPVRWLTMTVSFTDDPLPWPEGQRPPPRCETVTEVTDQFYFEFRKLASRDAEAPPPRPPKRRQTSKQEPARAPPPDQHRPSNQEAARALPPDQRRSSKQEAARAPPPDQRRSSNQESFRALPPPPDQYQALSKSLENLKFSSDWSKKSLPPTPPLDNSDEAPPLNPRKSIPRSSSCILPNMYVQTPKRNKNKAEKDSDHDHMETTALTQLA